MASYYKDILSLQNSGETVSLRKPQTLRKLYVNSMSFKKKFIYRLNDMFNFGGKLVLQKPIIADSKSSISLIYSRV